MSEVVENCTTGEAVKNRANQRKSLMLRSAKVVCQSGEYICLVRDVSELGTSLSFLHDVPPEKRIILSLANGMTFPIEQVWSGKKQAGYRFASPVSLAEFMYESSPFALRAVRLEIDAVARVMDGRDTFMAQVLDISTHGLKFECASDIKLARLIGFQITGMRQQLGQVVWHDGDHNVPRYGFQFQHPLGLQELAVATLRMQPFSMPVQTGFSENLAKASAA